MRMPNNPRDPNALWYKLIWVARRAITTGFLAQSDRMGMPGQSQAFWKALGLFWFGERGWRLGLLLFFLDGSFHNGTQIYSQLCSPHSGVHIVRETIHICTAAENKTRSISGKNNWKLAGLWLQQVQLSMGWENWPQCAANQVSQQT